MLSLSPLLPGEEPLVTTAAQLSVSSQKVACAFGKCPGVAIAVGMNSDRASFSLEPKSVAEIMAMVDCETDDDTALQVVRWGANPFSTSVDLSDDGGSSAFFPSVANVSVSAMSVTACGRELAVVNLSNPVRMELPIAARFVAHENEREQMVEGRCERSDSVVQVRCNATGNLVNLTCPTKQSRWNMTCPRIVQSPACLFWDGDKWSNYGVTVSNVTGTKVHCASTHMTNYLAIVGETATQTATVMRAYNEIRDEDLRKVQYLLWLLVGVYALSGAHALRDLLRMRNMRAVRARAIWSSDAFRGSIELIRAHNDDPAANNMPVHQQVLERVTMINIGRQNALLKIQNSTRADARQSIGKFLIALVDRATFRNTEPSYERAPTILMKLLTFLCGCTILHVRLLPILPPCTNHDVCILSRRVCRDRI